MLVLTDGSAWVEGIRQQLDAEGVPSTVVNLADPARPVITPAFLSGQLADGTPHAKFDGVVVPGSGVSAGRADGAGRLRGAVRDPAGRRLHLPERRGRAERPGVRRIAGRRHRHRHPGRAQDGAFRYLTGPVAFEDNDPAVAESFGYLATPLPDDPATGSHFEPILTAAAPGTSTQHALAGVHRTAAASSWSLTFAYN